MTDHPGDDSTADGPDEAAAIAPDILAKRA